MLIDGVGWFWLVWWVLKYSEDADGTSIESQNSRLSFCKYSRVGGGVDHDIEDHDDNDDCDYEYITCLSQVK